MIKNYIITAVRNLQKHRSFSIINILGLAVSMAICMGIIMLVADQMSYDRYNTKRDRIYRVNSIGVEFSSQVDATTTMFLRQELEEKYTGIEKVVRFKQGFGNNWLEFEPQNVNIPLTGYFADPEVFELFEFEFQYGDPATALNEPFSVVLTRKAANKLFKEENPLGKTLKVGKSSVYTVTGVLKETSNKSHIIFEGLASMSTLKSLLGEKDYREQMENWTNFWNGWTYVLLEKGINTQNVQQHLDKIYEDHIGSITNPGVYKLRFTLQSLLNITPGPFLNNSIGPLLPLMFIYFLGGLALVILLTSCFNFTNLSIARSLTRAREIGVRKVTGASRWQIFSQFLSEAIIVAFAALLIALGLMFVVKPMILQLNFARIFKWDLQANYIVYLIFFAFAILVGFLAGFFPATVLSAFQPVKVLKSLNNLKLFSRIGLRKALLVTQFTLSLFFILTVILIQNQLTFFLKKDYGFNVTNNVLVRLNNTSYQALKTELSKFNNITAVSAVSHVPAAGSTYGNGFKRKLDDPEWTNLGYFLVDEDYIDNMNVKLVAGSFFKSEHGEANRNFMVINRKAVERLKFSSNLDAINQEIIFEPDSSRRTIIGVVADYNHNDLMQTIKPMGLLYQPEQFNLVQVAYVGTYENASKSIEKAWEAVNPGMKIDYKEVESEINQFYEIVFGDVVKVLSFISFLAISISCLGLLGMATYATETRIKEISIRKVLGSSGAALVLLLSRGFIKIIAIAIAIGVPAAYFLNNLWLEQIAYHTTISASMIGIAVLILILLGALTIGSQTIRATFVKPVDNLKNE